jgi:acyl carrier protein
MDKKEVVVSLTSIFRKVFSDDLLELTDELSANDVDRWDSLSHMLLITEIEKCFSITFKLKDLNKMQNVGDMVEIIISKM